MNQLRHLDIFAGIGGFSLGLQRAGLTKPVCFVEIDPFCQRVLEQHWPGTPCDDDVRTREFTEGEADVITGGFPCQDLSLAGLGTGLSGARSGLYRHAIRAVRLVRPLYAILENVAALLGRGLGTVLGDLAEIGYDAEWHCIPASTVGAPHQRDRVWIIANPGSEQHEGYCAPLSGEIAKELAKADTCADSERKFLSEGPDRKDWPRSPDIGAQVADAGIEGFPPSERQELRGARRRCEGRAASKCGWWSAEPDVGRVAHGVPARVDRLRGLGNAIVPQVAELIGRAIVVAGERER